MGTAQPPQTQGSPFRRAFYAITAVVVVLIVGTVGFHLIEGLDWIDSFYIESMLATGQGPPFAMATDAGKIFASVMAFVSVASVATSIFLTLGPIFIQMWREGVEKVGKEARALEGDLTGKKEEKEGGKA
jgi:hypothetical protein